MVGEIMAKKNGINAVSNTVLIACGILILAGVLAFLFFNGDIELQQFDAIKIVIASIVILIIVVEIWLVK